jgi:hypothetical protein
MKQKLTVATLSRAGREQPNATLKISQMRSKLSRQLTRLRSCCIQGSVGPPALQFCVCVGRIPIRGGELEGWLLAASRLTRSSFSADFPPVSGQLHLNLRDRFWKSRRRRKRRIQQEFGRYQHIDGLPIDQVVCLHYDKCCAWFVDQTRDSETY